MRAGPRLCPPRSPATARGSAIRHQLRPNRPGPVPQERRALGTHTPAVVATHPRVGQDVLSTPPAYRPRPRARAGTSDVGGLPPQPLGQVSAQTWAGLYQPTPMPRKKKNGMETFFSRHLFFHSNFASLLFTIKQGRISVCIVLRNS